MPNTNHTQTRALALTDTIGNTPLVLLETRPNGSQIFAKLEGDNPAGSVKDRAALNMIKEAQKRGDIKPGDTLIEATSGNTGIALAMVATMLGYKMVLLLPKSSTAVRKAVLTAYGAQLIETESMEAARDLALTMQRNGAGFVLNQFDNPDNAAAHFATTAPELWAQTGGAITHFVSAMGTTGTISGVARWFKTSGNKETECAQKHAVQIIGVQPKDGASIAGIRRWAPEYLPKIFARNYIDDVLDVGQNEAEAETVRLARENGLFVGVSTGGAAFIARQVADKVAGARVVFVACDRGDRYVSSGLYSR